MSRYLRNWSWACSTAPQSVPACLRRWASRCSSARPSSGIQANRGGARQAGADRLCLQPKAAITGCGLNQQAQQEQFRRKARATAGQTNGTARKPSTSERVLLIGYADQQGQRDNRPKAHPFANSTGHDHGAPMVWTPPLPAQSTIGCQLHRGRNVARSAMTEIHGDAHGKTVVHHARRHAVSVFANLPLGVGGFERRTGEKAF